MTGMRVLPLLSLIWVSSSLAIAQTTGTATILGAVTDSTGAAVVGARVTVLNIDTSFISSSITTTEGTYYVPYLSPGPYRLTIEAAGFKQYVREGIVLRMNESPRIDVQVEVGSVTESVTVTAAPPLLETETAAAGQIVGARTIVRIPVLEKMFNRMVLYMPGMNVINGQHAIGQRERSLGLTVDGISGKEPVLGSPNDYSRIVTTTLDMVQEFKLWTTGLPAEFGHSSGGLLSAVFKSGTNQFHGSMEDRYLPPALVNRSYFEILPTDYLYHEAAVTAGGPIILPRIYNGRDRTFFFVGVGRHHGEIYESFTGDVPSAEMYAGDFSFGGRGLPIYDPMTTRQDASGRWIRDPLPQNQVPQSRFDPAVRNLLGYNPWRAANSPGIITPNGPQQNLVVSRWGGYFFTKIDGKVDHQFSPYHKIFGRYSQMRHRAPGRETPQVAWKLTDPNFVIPADQRNAVVSDTYTFNPTTINELRVGFNRRRSTRLPESYNQGWANRLGIPNVGPETFPQFSPNYGMGPGGKDQQVAEDFSVQENFTKVMGLHTMKAGYELIRTRYNALVQTLPSGSYVMGGTENPFTPNTGNPFASLLLGTVASATFTQATATWLPRWWSHAFYFQDDYKPVRTLTLNIGLRWSYESPFQTKYGQQSQFDPSATDPITGKPGAIIHRAGALAKRDLNNFQPRVGLAWNFKRKFVFRSNFGIITSDLMVNGINQNFEEYFATVNVQSPPGDPRIAFRLSEGPPPFRFNIAENGSVPFVGSNYSARNASWYDPNMRMPYVMNWSGGFQWEFASTWLAEFLYQGSSGVGLLNNWDTNVVPLDVSKDPVRLEQIRQQYQNFKPYPQLGGVQLFSNFGHNTYHGGTLRFEKRYSSGLTMNSFYTFSKTINDADTDGAASGITYYNRRLEKARANYDVNHRWVTTVTYELPVGKGRKFINRGGWRNAIFGGWDLAWIQTFQTGPPFTVTFAGSPNRYLPGASRPIQLVPNDVAKLKHVDIGPNRFPFSAQNRYLQLDAFTYPDSFQPGTLGRNTLQAPGLVWIQTSLEKHWMLGERLRFHLRFDSNNPIKYQNFAAPNAVYNATNPANFGTFSGVRGSFSDIGTSRTHGIFVLRLEW
jgi:hypothetical protein